MAFVKTEVEKLTLNPFTKIGKEWFLLTSGTPDCYNTMTASWGQMGVLWGKNVLTAYVRTSRKTFELVEQNNLFTVSFLPQADRPILQFCGSHSGRDCDKAKETGLIPVGLDGSTAFEQASLVLVCRKLYAAPLDMKQAVDPTIASFYEKDAMHHMYIAEILSAYENK